MLRRRGVNKMNSFLKNIIIIFITIGFIWYLYTIILNWQLVTDGKLWVGLIRILVPFSVNILIYLVLYEKINLNKNKQKEVIK